MIKVRSSDGRVFWERHADHPGQEVFVAGDNVVEVAETPAVLRALSDARLVKVQAEEQAADLQAVDGIGPKTAADLKAAGVETLADLIAADPTYLEASIGATVERIVQWQENAREIS